MIDLNSLFYVHSGGVDLDVESTFVTNSFVVDSTDSIYLGYYKPFDSFSIQFDTSGEGSEDIVFNINSSPITAYDFTENLSRDGSVQWVNDDSWTVETIGGREAYWVEITSAVSNPMQVKGIGVLFCGDQDIEAVYPSVLGANISTALSRAKVFRGATTYIMQMFHNKGFEKDADAEGFIEPLTAFDLLRKYEVRQAASYLSVGRLLQDASDTPEDIFDEHSRLYITKGEKLIDSLYRLTIDLDDDGEESAEENEAASKIGSIFLDFG